MNRYAAFAAALAVALTAAGQAGAAPRGSPAPFQEGALAIDRILSPAVDMLEVTSSAFDAGQPIPEQYSGYGKNLSFPLSWTAGPANTVAYAIIMEDPDSGPGQPTLHWLAYNIPAKTTSLGRNVRNSEVVKAGAKAMMQGRNSKGGVGYVGPHPKAGDPPHHYHIQVFALSRMLPLGGGASLDKVIAAMTDRVAAEGELVATFEAPKPTPAPATP